MRAEHDKNPPAAPLGPFFDTGAGGITTGGYLFIAFQGIFTNTKLSAILRG